MKYRKKPVVIEAIEWTGDNLREVIDFTGKHPRFDEWFPTWDAYEEHVRRDRNVIKIFTLEGVMEASPGDWIIRGIKGEHYPCKPGIFAATYEPAHVTAEKDAEIERLRGCLSNLVEAVDVLIAESEGVYGLHRNGDPAPWEELTEGGQFEAWLLALEDARAALDGEKEARTASQDR